MNRSWSLAVLFIAAACASSPSQPPKERPQPVPDRIVDSDGDARLEREEWLLQRRREADGQVRADAFARGLRSWEAWSTAHPSLELKTGSPLGARTWQEAGPRNIAGRVLSVAFDPESPDVIWAGSAGGGLWRSGNFGSTWKQIGGDHLPSLWISAIAVDPKNPKVLYMGTGETNQNYGGYGGFGGMLKTTDGGQTFTRIDLPEYGFFRTIVSAANSNLVLAAAGSGVYRSGDAGAHFTKTLEQCTSDLAQDPNNPSRFLAVRSAAYGNPHSGLFETLDAGLTWRALGAGLPAPGDWGRSAVAFSPAPSSVVLLAVGQKIGGNLTPTLFRSIDGGNTWSPHAVDNQSGYSGVGWYGAHLSVAPFNENLVVQANGGSVLISHDGGLNWTRPAGDWHVDTHGIAFHPLDHTRMVLATDGGVAVSADGGATFNRKDQGFPTVQFYSCAVGLADSKTLFGGTQDNWMSVYRGAPGGAWEYTYPPGLGDVGGITINPLSPHQVSAVTAGAADIGYSSDEGRTWAPTRQNGIPQGEGAPWAARLARSPLHPERVYLGARRLEVSSNNGQSWSPIVVRPDLSNLIIDLAVSPSDDREIWTLWSDAKVFVSEDAGTTWQEHSPPSQYRAGNRISAGSVKGTAYVALSGTEGARVFRTHDAGLTWTDISRGLPDLVINTILADPHQPGTLFAATDAGVAASTDDGQTWQDASGELPRAVVFDLCLDPSSGRLAAATYGRGLWELALPPPCTPDAATLCLNGGRFEVKASWASPTASGVAQAVRLTADTGYFYFFDSSNVEAVVKVIDGCGFNQSFWVFAGGLTNLQATITVKDSRTGVVKTYKNPQGKPFQPVQDTSAFSTCNSTVRTASAGQGEPWIAPRSVSGTSLFLNNDRFKVDVTWKAPDGRSGTGMPVPLTSDTGYFWFFDSGNVEMVIKVLNGCGFNQSYWVFAGGLTNVQTTLTVTDTATGRIKTYLNPQNRAFQPIQDTSTFSTCP